MRSVTEQPGDAIGLERWPVWSTTVVVAVEPFDAIDEAASMLRLEIASFDRACNRFRADSEISALNRVGNTTEPASPTFVAALSSALWAARATDGAVDPTVGR